MSPNAEICLFFLPPAIYLILLGGINLRKCPCVLNGASDRLLLGLALAGPILVGPIRFLPLGETFAFWELFELGSIVWALILFLLIMFSSLISVRSRPKIVIYNIAPESVGPLLWSVIPKLDSNYRQVGNSVFLPDRGIQFYIESNPWMRNTELIATTRTQGMEEWHQLSAKLQETSLQSTPPKRIPWCAVLLFLTGIGFFLFALPSLCRFLFALSLSWLLFAV